MRNGFAAAAAMVTLFSGQASEPMPSQIGDEVVELFEQLRTPLLRYLMTLGLHVQDGEEVIQEVFLALFQHLKKGKRGDNLRGWIFRVAHNLALKQFRSTKSKIERASVPIDEVQTEFVSPAATPEEMLEQANSEERIQAVIQALPEQDRRCLFLRAEGLRYREIAEALGISLGSVANSLERAIGKLSRAREQVGA
ncbi:RNA polymerase sigma-70 factor (ECF subfamily) [Edaphobacter aggregans]|uniref:RNA polymerase sigma-70 factor (ECF subfamily) n=1 Tax=Edaphobacter aggregans TaxID=570835 RepID=A0A428MFY8_9BACT|nr:RNA polymerase sigma factor [Edaphobacter aggregans]RSL15787.1 RNA polymerase sigma-70 factor (ECF subfamily) [Edaphobacter aggregans]